MNKNYSETFLARWLNNDLTPNEKKDFEASDDFLLYKKIAEKSTALTPPEFNKEEVLKNIKSKINQNKETKVVSFIKPWMYGVAASVLMLFGLFYFLNLTEEYSTGIGKQLAIVLPDNSKVLMNANSTISYDEKNWDTNRTVKLKGEAYFKVEKGSTFNVKTKQGNVTVLGTQFNVKTDENFFEVVCFEGKVKAASLSHKSILTKGNAFRSIKDSLPEKWNIKAIEPSWKNGESSFKSTPLKYVIKALTNQYKIKINSSKIDVNKKFTGSFTHKNLQVALQTIFVPMKIGVTFKGEKNILLYKQ